MRLSAIGTTRTTLPAVAERLLAPFFAGSALASQLGAICREALEHNGLQGSEVDWLVPHQANVRIIDATAQKMGLPPERVVLTLEHQGNTSAASVPLALDAAVRDGRIQPGHLVVLAAVGGGMTWGAALLRW